MADSGGILLCLIQKKGEKLNHTPAQHQKYASLKKLRKRCVEQSKMLRWREIAYLFIAFAVVLLWKQHASAQIDPKNPTQTCVPLDTIKQTSKIMEQRQVIRGLNQRQELVIITANPFTERWTAWQSVQGVYLCVVAFGSVFTLIEEKVGNGS